MKDEFDKVTLDLPLPKDSTTVFYRGLRQLVPVSFVAKDWGVSTRRIRALLSCGRLEGCRRENGYGEVFQPYTVTHGLRGPALKRKNKSAKLLKLVVDNVERMAE